MAALIAAMMPLTAAVNGYVQLQQQVRFQRHEIRLKYLDRAIDPSQPPEYRERVLSFLLATLDDDDPMRRWASGESDILAEVLNLRDQVASKERETAKLRQELDTALANGATQEQLLSERLRELERDLATQRAVLASKEREARVASLIVFGPDRSSWASGPIKLPPDVGDLSLFIPVADASEKVPTVTLTELASGRSAIVEAREQVNDRGRALVVRIPPEFMGAGWYQMKVFRDGETNPLVWSYRLERDRSDSE